MCDICDGKVTMAEANARMDGLIKKYGWACMYIENRIREKSFCYTVGLTPLGFPEFLVRGLGPEESIDMLNAWAQMVVGGEAIKAGETALYGMHLMYFSKLAHPEDTACDAVRRYGQRVRVIEAHFMTADMTLPGSSHRYN